MVQIENLPLVLTGLGLMASILYYTMILRNANKTQQNQLETRQVQMFMQIYNQYQAPEYRKASRIFHLMKFETFEEYSKLIDPNTPETLENYEAVVSIITYYEGLGSLVKEGFLDIRWIALLMTGTTRQIWEKLDPVINEMRMREDYPRLASEMEYLYHELMKYVEEHPELAT